MITINEIEPGNFELYLDESFDFESHKDFRQCIKDAMKDDPKMLAIDFSRVEYIDSSALGMLMLAKHEAEEHNCKIELANVQEGHAMNVLNLVKFDKMFCLRK